MKTKNIIYGLLLLLFTGIHANAFENDPQAICLRPGTNELYVGGEFKTVMVIDAETGKSIRQFDIPEISLGFTFTKDGQRLLVADDNHVYYLNPETGEQLQSLEIRGPKLFGNSPYFISLDDFWANEITVYNVENGNPMFKYECPYTPLSVGFNTDNTELIIISREMDIKKENALIQKEVIPVDGYDVYNRKFTEQQKDGKGSAFTVIDIQNNVVKIDATLPYTPSNSFAYLMSKYNDFYYILGFDMMIKIDNEGKAYPIEPKKSGFAYASGNSADGRYIYYGGMNELNVFDCSTGTQFEFGMNEKEAAYAQEFYISPYKLYLLNNDLNVHVCTLKGVRQKTLVIEQISEGGFAVYYYNGFFKKEDRDKEAKIINAALADLGREPIDLEMSTGDSNFLLGVFETKAEADKFQQTIDENGVQYLSKVAPYSAE